MKKRILAMQKHVLALAITLSTFSAQVVAAAAEVDPLANPPVPAFKGQTAAPAPARASVIKQEVIATGLTLPRSLSVLPDGNLVVTENSGAVRILRQDGTLSAPLPGMPEMLSVAGRTMNDFVLDANFASNRRVYFTYLAPAPGQAGGDHTPAARTAAAQQGIAFQIDQLASARLADDLTRIEDVRVLGEYPGRRLLSAPDGTLYITTMAFNETSKLAQDTQSLAGKVLRINSDGSIPQDNPYAGSTTVRPEIFSLGHRDSDGLFINPETGELWAIEHGPMGGDEVNIIRKGNNYGWPLTTYGKEYDGTELGPSLQDGMEQPLYYWFPSVAVSGLLKYTGALFPDWQGDLFLGTMSPTQGKFLVRLAMDGEKVVQEEHLLVENDRRVRAVAQDIDGAIYVLTDSENNNQTNRHFSGEVLKLTQH